MARSNYILPPALHIAQFLAKQNPLRDARSAQRAQIKAARKIGARGKISEIRAGQKERFGVAREQRKSLQSLQANLIGSMIPTAVRYRPTPAPVGRGAQAIQQRDKAVAQKERQSMRRARGLV